MNTGTHWTQDEIDDDKDYQIEVLEKEVGILEKEVERLKKALSDSVKAQLDVHEALTKGDKDE